MRAGPHDGRRDSIRIAHVIYRTRKGGGLQRVVLNLLRGLDARRFEQYLVAYRREEPELDLNGIRLLPTTPLTDARRWSQQRRFAREVARHIRVNRIDILHCHTIRHTRWLMLRSRLAGARVIRTLHSTLGKKETRSGLVSRLWNRLASATVACSSAVASTLEEAWGIPAASILVIPNGIDLGAFVDDQAEGQRKRRELGLKGADIALLSVGRLDQLKQHDVQIRAMADVLKSAPDCRLFIAGTGDQEQPLCELIRTLGLDGAVRLLGHRDDIPALLNACDIFTLSTRWEGLPLAVIEAMAARRPVISTDAEGMDYIVEHERTGLLVPVGDSKAFAAAVLRLARDHELRRRFGEAARRRVEREFSLPVMLKRYAELYERVMGF